MVKVFITMLAKKDEDFIVRGDLYQLAKWANKQGREDEVLLALRVLESPDTRKPLVKQDFDGRRIEPVEGGWLVLNGHKYREMIRKVKRREYKRVWQQEKRAERPGEEGMTLSQKIHHRVNEDPVTKSDQAAAKKKGWGKPARTKVMEEYDIEDEGDANDLSQSQSSNAVQVEPPAASPEMGSQ